VCRLGYLPVVDIRSSRRIVAAVYEIVEARFTQRSAAPMSTRYSEVIEANGQEWFFMLSPRLRHYSEGWVEERIAAVIGMFSLPVAPNSQLQLH
jgi:hypothetical protein